MDAWPTAPSEAAPWPERIAEPQFSGPPPALDVPDGLYCSVHPSGRLRLLAKVWRGRLEQWLRLEDGTPAGCYKTEGSPWFGQRFYAEGLVEDFARDDDTSKPYPAEETFLEWASGHRERMVAPPGPMPDWMAESFRIYEEMKAGDRPPAGADRVLSAEPPPDLEERLSAFGGLNWHSQYQCHERLLHYFKWEPELARDFANFATAACAWSLREPGQRPETFLVTDWEGVQERPLDEIPLFVRIRDAALAEGDGRSHFRHWVRCLAECTQGPGSPIVWTVPPSGMGEYRVTRRVVELLLRQEASHGAEMEGVLASVDRDRFFEAASRVGAFLQSAEEPPDADELLAALDRPVLDSLGAWAHLQAGGLGRPANPGWLGRFVNERREVIRQCVAELRRGELCWPASSRVGGIGFRGRAEEFLEEMGLDLGAQTNRFLLRVEVAGRLLAEAPWKARGVERDALHELQARLEGVQGESQRWLEAAAWALPERDARPLARALMSALPG